MGNLLTLLDDSQNSINEQADRPLIMDIIFGAVVDKD